MGEAAGSLGEGQIDESGEVGAGKGGSAQQVTGWRGALAGFAFFAKGKQVLQNKKVLIGRGIFVVTLIVLSVWVYFGRRGGRSGRNENGVGKSGVGRSGMGTKGSVDVGRICKQNFGFRK